MAAYDNIIQDRFLTAKALQTSATHILINKKGEAWDYVRRLLLQEAEALQKLGMQEIRIAEKESTEKGSDDASTTTN